MIEKYVCEFCGEDFLDKDKCLKHEKQHTISSLTCNKCGKEITFSMKDIYTFKNKRHIIDLGRMSYGSKLDGCDVYFTLCDDCLVEFIETLNNKEDIYNSGANFRY